MSKEFNATHGKTFLIKTCSLATQTLPWSISKVAVWKWACVHAPSRSRLSTEICRTFIPAFKRTAVPNLIFAFRQIQHNSTEQNKTARSIRGAWLSPMACTFSRLASNLYKNKIFFSRLSPSLLKQETRGVGGWNVYTPILWSDKGWRLQVTDSLPANVCEWNVTEQELRNNHLCMSRDRSQRLGLHLRLCSSGLCWVYYFSAQGGCPIKQPQTKRPLCVE